MKVAGTILVFVMLCVFSALFVTTCIRVVHAQTVQPKITITPSGPVQVGQDVAISCRAQSWVASTWMNIVTPDDGFVSSERPQAGIHWTPASNDIGAQKIECDQFHWDNGAVSDGSKIVYVTVEGPTPPASPTPVPTATPVPSPTPSPIPTSCPCPSPTVLPTPAPPGPTTSSTFYVDPSGGDDANAGTLSSPWKTLAKVMSIQSTLTGGQSVLLKGGGVWNEQFDVNAAGSSGSPITFGTYGTGRAILDEQGNNQYCVNATGRAAYLTFNNWECTHATEQGVTFKTTGGGMPGIVVANFWIHDTGPGCSNSNGPCVGTDDGKYANQLDFDDYGQGANGVQFLNNTVQWCGGHNCLQVHHDTGGVIVQGNTVGPGCVHGCLDVKGVGSPNFPAVVSGNSATCGVSQGLASNPNCAAFYTENTYSPDETLTYSNDTAMDSPIGYQACAGACAISGRSCGMHLTYSNDTSSSTSTALYAHNGGCGGGSNSPFGVFQSGNHFNGSISVGGLQ